MAKVNEAENIFYKSRIAAAVHCDRLRSREGAAEMLGVSPSSLADYELGNTKVVPVDKVNLMADVYNAPELRGWYCSNICPLGGDMPKVEAESLDRIVVKAVAAFKKIDEAELTLLEITENGDITEDNMPKLIDVVSVLKQLVWVERALSLWAEKK